MKRSNEFHPHNFSEQPVSRLILTTLFGFLLGIFGGGSLLASGMLGVNLWSIWSIQDVETFSASAWQPVEEKLYADVVAFLEADRVNEVVYNVGVYDCKEYALFTWSHAIRFGFKCVPVLVELDGPFNHMIIAFETSDRGVVFIEPQSDKEVFPATWSKYFGYDIVSLQYFDMATTPVLNQRTQAE